MRLVLLAALGGCNYLTDSFVINTFSGDPFPTTVETSSGAIVIGAQPDDDVKHTAVLDVLSPVTLVDRGVGVAPSVDYPNVTLFGESASGGGAFDLPRAKLVEPEVISLHPCNMDSCNVGTPAAPRSFDAIIGINAFASDALRLHLAPDASTNTDQIFILPDIAGDEIHRSRSCDAVFPSPFRGGGTLIVNSTEVPFSNWRITLDTCLGFDPDIGKLQSERGADVLLVASTALGISLLDRSAYERYRQVVPTAPAYGVLPEDSVLLQSGPITGRRTTIDKFALVAKSASARSPCRQVYAHHLLSQRDCVTGDDCPCTADDPNQGHFCAVPAVLELTPPTAISVLIIDDNDGTLQALRTELRPDQPEVDGILGTDALRTFELDIDYPNGRVLARCTGDRTQCITRPELPDPIDRPQVNGCIGP